MSKKKTTGEFIIDAIKVHGDKYGYSLVEYINCYTNVIIKCKYHNEYFLQTPNRHLNGSNCPTCAQTKRSQTYKTTIKNKKSSVTEIPVPKGSKAIPITKDIFTLVDEEDYENVIKYNWHLSGGKYAYNTDVGLMHRFIMKVTDKNIYVDHKYHNCLDNRKKNLRLCTQQENCSNQQIQKNAKKSSLYKGVFWDKERCKWQSVIKHNQKRIFIGRFDNEIDAAKAYDAKAIELFKEFAFINIKIDL